MNEPKLAPERPEMADKPPLLGSWRRLYTAEILIVVVLIGLFWLVTAHYA